MGNKTFDTSAENVLSVQILNNAAIDTPVQATNVDTQAGSYIGKNAGTQPANWDPNAKALVGIASKLPQITSNGAYPVKDATPAAPTASALAGLPSKLPL